MVATSDACSKMGHIIPIYFICAKQTCYDGEPLIDGMYWLTSLTSYPTQRNLNCTFFFAVDEMEFQQVGK